MFKERQKSVTSSVRMNFLPSPTGSLDTKNFGFKFNLISYIYIYIYNRNFEHAHVYIHAEEIQFSNPFPLQHKHIFTIILNNNIRPSASMTTINETDS